MKLAFSSNAYMRFSVEETIRRVAAMGYAGIEILADVPHAWPAFLLEERKESIRRTLAECGLEISNINAFMMNAVSDPRQHYWYPSWIEPDKHYRRIRIEHTKRALTLAREIGAKCITTEPGGPLGPGQSWERGAELFVEGLKVVLEHAEKEGVLLLVEPEPGLLVERVDQYLEIASRIDSPALGMNFDIGHAYCVSEEPAEFIPKCAEHIKHFHFEDIAATRVHQHLIPGHGAIDFAATMRAIREIRYDGWITVELYPYIDDPDAAAREALEYVRGVTGGG
jgi:sugar phosphate isomerase/epimerase